MCVYVYIYKYVYIYMYVFIYIHMSVCMCVTWILKMMVRKSVKDGYVGYLYIRFHGYIRN